MSARPPSAADLRARVLGAVQREPIAPRPRESRRLALILLGFAAAGAVALTHYGLDRALNRTGAMVFQQSLWHPVSAGGVSAHHSLEYVVTLGVAWAIVVVGATWVGVARGRSLLGRSQKALLLVATLTPAALALTWLAVAHVELPTLDEVPEARLQLHCTLLSVAYSLGPLVAFFAARRHTDPFHPRWGGAAIGAVAGAWGALLYIASCECSSPVHIAISHILPVAMLAVAGALAGERVLRPPNMRRAPKLPLA